MEFDHLVDVAKETAKIMLKFSPAVAALLGSPATGVLVLNGLAKVFNVDPIHVSEVIDTDHSASERIRQFELEHNISMAKIDSDDYKTEVQDRMNARENQYQKRDWLVSTIAILVVVGFILLSGALLFIDPEDEKYFIGQLLQIGSAFAMVIFSLFGSYSRRKQ